MSDLFEEGGPEGNAPEFTVSELSGAVKRTVEGAFSHVRVRAELGRVSRPASGHIYLDLKDDRAVIAGVMWKGTASKLTTRPEEGMEVIITGRMTTFPGQSKYQIVIESLAPAGVGALMAMLEKRKAQLGAEGLFEASRKKPLPYLPQIIGVVTSPSGAVIRDILHRLRDRFPRKVLLWPVVVQGEKCAGDVANAIRGFNALTQGGALPRPDVLIVARGGGSLEDLWGFNEEIVVRAVADSTIPVISAVGHETDTTLIDYAADRRAPTPTAAAEMAVPVRADLLAHIAGLEERRRRALARMLDERGRRLRDLSRALPRLDTLTSQSSQRLDQAALRLDGALERFARAKRLSFVSGPAGRLNKTLLTRSLTDRTRSVTLTSDRLSRALIQRTARAADQLNRLTPRLKPDPLRLGITRGADQLRGLADRKMRLWSRQITAQRKTLTDLDRVRLTVGYQATLKRGYAVVRGKEDEVLTTSKAAGSATRLSIEFADGRIDATPGDTAPPARPKRKAAPKPEDQGSLF